MRVIDLQQRSEGWHKWRSNGLSASEAAIILGKSPHKTIWRLWAERRGIVRKADLSGNPHIRRGIAMEPVARCKFEQRHDTLLLPLCGQSDDHPLMRASFDGIDENGIPVELKCPSDSVFEEVKSQGENSADYQLYWHQVQHQILVAGTDHGWLSFYKEGGDFVDFLIVRDDQFITELLSSSMDFWAMLQSGKEPKKDPERDIFIPTGEELETWTALSAEYRRLADKCNGSKARIKGWESEMDALELRLQAIMGDQVQGESAGLRMNIYVQQGPVDYKAALAELAPGTEPAELARFKRPDSLRVRVTLKEEDKADVPFDLKQLEDHVGNDWSSNFEL